MFGQKKDEGQYCLVFLEFLVRSVVQQWLFLLCFGFMVIIVYSHENSCKNIDSYEYSFVKWIY